ncbi:hypothetical protein DWB84_10545 [Saccharophagus sp. K07]|nr:hypothetical protein [Saccharophagus sp. K07]
MIGIISSHALLIKYTKATYIAIDLRIKAMSQAITKILYEFNDSAVPPPYHRSYRITVTLDQCHLMIHAYGEIILEKFCTIELDVFEKLAKDALALPIQTLPKAGDSPVSIGGSSRLITLYSGNEVIFRGTDGADPKSHRLVSFAQELMSLCPDFPKDLVSN